MSREERNRQLLTVAWAIVREEGSDALTLGRLAEKAEIAKPVVYDHFKTRNGLLAALYLDFDVRQTEVFDAAVAAAKPTLKDKAEVIASSYVDCVLLQGRELPGVLAALAGSPEMEKLMRTCQLEFIEKCRGVLEPFSKMNRIPTESWWAMLGAADSLSNAAALGEISAAGARKELFQTIVAIVERKPPRR